MANWARIKFILPILILGCGGAVFYYISRDAKLPELYSADYIQTDCYTEYLINKYMVEETLRRSVRVNLETALYALHSEDYKLGGILQRTGEKVTLANIFYADDCTILYLTTPAEFAFLSAPNTNEWWISLTVKDLNTGERWKLMQMSDNKTRSTADGIHSIVLFFPPFKSRNFSLVHETLPMPDINKVKESYSGLMGRVYKIGTALGFNRGNSDIYTDYNFSEVLVR